QNNTSTDLPYTETDSFSCIISDSTTNNKTMYSPYISTSSDNILWCTIYNVTPDNKVCPKNLSKSQIDESKIICDTDSFDTYIPKGIK
ncbi:MAG: hypothetical protein UIH99_02355, partial [Alphaproteobacteria bacterium]|nr:hypothetical protein [Alphaproteobacteria bacterium]